jgi:hypothetical protein
MGPWFIRDESRPFRPGCSFETLSRLAARGKIGPQTIVRGPTTRQFWMFARNTPGVASLFGECHSCHQRVEAGDAACDGCGADLTAPDDRQHLGLGPVHLLRGHATPQSIAAASSTPPASGGALMLALGVSGIVAGLAALGGMTATIWPIAQSAATAAVQPNKSLSNPPQELRAEPVLAADPTPPPAASSKMEPQTAPLANLQGRVREHERITRGL